MKIVASELRNLVCMSSGTEGLLWRLIDELGVFDEIPLAGGGTVNRDHPLAVGMEGVMANSAYAGVV
jgi:hypothetical protein